MSDFCFSFLENQYRDIYLDCARMDKNLIEGDGVESILIAGRIAEKITKTIFEYENFQDNGENQFKRLERLNNANILPNKINNDFKELRRLRNDVYHNTLTSKTLSSNLNDYNQFSKVENNANTSLEATGGLRDYKTGLSVSKNHIQSKTPKRAKTPNHIKFQKSKKSNSKYEHNRQSKGGNSKYFDDSFDFSSEMVAAREAHKLTFNICVWFYVNYSGDKDFIRPQYKLGKRTQDSDFLLRLKSAINDGDDFIQLKNSNPNNEIIAILSEIYIPKREVKKEDNIVYGLNNKDFKIRKPDGPYSKELGISYDDNIFMWEARHAGKNLGYFQSSKEAFKAREIYIRSLPVPPKVDGRYSKVNGISFSKIQKLWTASVKGQVIAYYNSEKAAIKGRNRYLNKHDLIDLKVDGGFKTVDKSVLDKSKNSKSKVKNSLDNSNNLNNMEKSSNSLDNSNNLNNMEKSKVKAVNGSKVSSNKKAKKVKVSLGSRVSKKNKSNKQTISKMKSSKYDGVFYEEGLFMWSAEFDGKHLGLFASEEEAHEKREEYLKNKS